MSKRNEWLDELLFPNDDADKFTLDLRMHLARVEAAARFLDTAKISDLRRQSTGDRVIAANKKWLDAAHGGRR